MVKRFKIVLIALGTVFVSISVVGQDGKINVEESAEVFLEEYSDMFQESFFEALKQKGIENYDKAANLLLECKLIDKENHVVDHELAKVYLIDKKYIQAREYAIAALLSEPENLWYLNTLVDVVQMQGSLLENIKSSIPFGNYTLKQNLALIYFRQKNYEGALRVIRDIKKSTFTEELSSKINDSIKKRDSKKEKEQVTSRSRVTVNPLEGLKGQISKLINKNDWSALKELSDEALENYPSQPYFYYANGYALNRVAKHSEAVEVLETALDYILDDDLLLNRIYQELADAHTALNNSTKANMYIRMIKPGF